MTVSRSFLVTPLRPDLAATHQRQEAPRRHAQLKNGTKKGRLQIVLLAKSYEFGIYFFPTKGTGVTENCANSTGSGGPPHFSPAALFRDSFNVGGQLTTQTAIIDVPATLRGNGDLTRFDRPDRGLEGSLQVGFEDDAVGSRLDQRPNSGARVVRQDDHRRRVTR